MPQDYNYNTNQYAYSDEGAAFYNEIGGHGRTMADEQGTFTPDTLNMKSLTGVFGAPYQFLPSVDPRLLWDKKDEGPKSEEDELNRFGRKYAEKIATRMPVMYFAPGNPRFMPQIDKKRKDIVSQIASLFSQNNTNELESLLGEYGGKYYYIDMAYEDYYNYVNPMCRCGAMFLGIGEKYYCGKKLREFPWHLNTNTDESIQAKSNEEGNKEPSIFDALAGLKGIVDTVVGFFTATLTQDFGYYRRCIPFYIESEAQITETFTNDTTESSLAGMANGLSDQARELRFILGATGAELGFDTNKLFEGGDELIAKIEQSLGGEGHNIFANVVKTFGTIAMGGRLVFPEIWSDSKFSKSYSVTIKLATPDSDIFSWYLNIYVPLMHLLALALPRQYGNNGYGAPFLVRAYYKAFFNIDMGIITNLTVVKGKEGGWTRDGLPTTVDVTVEIKDLYQELAMTKGNDMRYNIMKNTAELDYMANLCGVNINAPDITRFIDMYYMVNFENRISDWLTNDIWGGLQSAVGNFTNNAWQRLIKRI